MMFTTTANRAPGPPRSRRLGRPPAPADLNVVVPARSSAGTRAAAVDGGRAHPRTDVLRTGESRRIRSHGTAGILARLLRRARGTPGAVDANVVVATFFGFHPDFVRRAVPAIWSTTTPARAIDARLEGARAALRRIAGPTVTEAAAGVAVRRLREGDRADLGRGPATVRGERRARLARRSSRRSVAHGHVCAPAPRRRTRQCTVGRRARCLRGPRAAHRRRRHPGRVDTGPPGWSAEAWTLATQRLRAQRSSMATAERHPRGRKLRARIEGDTDRLNAVLVDRVAEARAPWSTRSRRSPPRSPRPA